MKAARRIDPFPDRPSTTVHASGMSSEWAILGASILLALPAFFLLYLAMAGVI